MGEIKDAGYANRGAASRWREGDQLGLNCQATSTSCTHFQATQNKNFVDNQNKFRKGSRIWPGDGEPALRGGEERNELIQAGDEKTWKGLGYSIPMPVGRLLRSWRRALHVGE